MKINFEAPNQEGPKIPQEQELGEKITPTLNRGRIPERQKNNNKGTAPEYLKQYVTKKSNEEKSDDERRPRFDSGELITYTDKSGKKREGKVLSKHGDWKHGMLVERKRWLRSPIQEFIKKDWAQKQPEDTLLVKKHWWQFFKKNPEEKQARKPGDKIIAEGFDSNMQRVRIEIPKHPDEYQVGDKVKWGSGDQEWKLSGVDENKLLYTLEKGKGKNRILKLINRKDLERIYAEQQAKLAAKKTQGKQVAEDAREQAREISLDDVEEFEHQTYGKPPKIPAEEAATRFIPGQDFNYYKKTEQDIHAEDEAGIPEGSIKTTDIKTEARPKVEITSPTPKPKVPERPKKSSEGIIINEASKKVEQKEDPYAKAKNLEQLLQIIHDQGEIVSAAHTIEEPWQVVNDIVLAGDYSRLPKNLRAAAEKLVPEAKLDEQKTNKLMRNFGRSPKAIEQDSQRRR